MLFTDEKGFKTITHIYLNSGIDLNKSFRTEKKEVIKDIFDITRRTQMKYFCYHNCKTVQMSTSQFSLESVIRERENCKKITIAICLNLMSII